MSDRIDRLIDAAISRWSTPSGLVLALAAAALLLAGAFTQVDFSRITPTALIISSAVLVVIVGVWRFTRLPRAPKGTVGFGIALAFENREHEKRVRADLIESLRQLVTGSKFRYRFHFIPFSQSVAERISDPQ